MRWSLSKVRATACPGPSCILFIILLTALAGPSLAQDEIDVDLGRIGLSQLSILSPAMIYRPIDGFSGRPGGDALGMGGAYLASASGATALGWNAAGLADLEHPGFSFDGYFRTASSGTSGYPDSLVIPSLSTLYLTSYRTGLKGGFVPDFIAAGTPLWISGERRLVAAFGWRHYAETALPGETVSELTGSGGGATFPAVFSFDRTEKGSLEAFSPALAFRAGPALSLGAALNVLAGGVRANTDQRFTFSGQPFRGSFRADNRYSGISPEFGGRVNVGSRIAVGVRVAPGFTLKVRDGTFEARSISAPGTPRYVVVATLADYDLSIPSAFGAGVAIRPLPRLLIAADVNAQSWSKTKVKYVGSSAPDSAELPLADVTTVHFGAEYKLLRTSWGDVPVRLGFRTAPIGSVSEDTLDVQHNRLPTGEVWASPARDGRYHGEQPKANAFSFGVSLETPGIHYDLGFESLSYDTHKWLFEQPYDLITNPNWTLVKVKQKVRKLRLSATYAF